MTSPVVSERNAVKPWDASMPLRADATDRQIDDRWRALPAHSLAEAIVKVAREFAAACAASPVLVSREPTTELIERTANELRPLIERCFREGVRRMRREEQTSDEVWRDVILYTTNAAIGQAHLASPSGASPAAPDRQLLERAAKMLEDTMHDHPMEYEAGDMEDLAKEIRAALSPSGSAAT